MSYIREHPHGFVDNFAFDDAALPESFWRGVLPLDDGCWAWQRDRIGRVKVSAQEYVITRLLGVKWSDVLAWSPTCANYLCVNPTHLCVTLRTEGTITWLP